MAVYRPPLSLLALTHMGDWQLGRGRRAAVARCCVALDGDGVGHVLAHLGDEEVPLVAAYVGEPRGNEAKCLRDLLCAGARNPWSATSDTESWWTNGNGDWRHASEGLKDSYERLGGTSQCRCRSTLSSHSPATSMVRVCWHLRCLDGSHGATPGPSYYGGRRWYSTHLKTASTPRDREMGA